MSNNLLHDNNWPLYCKDCGRACPIDDSGRFHGNRRLCPSCFAKENPGKKQVRIPDYWVHMCSWEFMEKNFPKSYCYYYQKAIEEQFASSH